MTALLLAVALLVIGPLRPDVRLTPGISRPLTMVELCATKWGRDRRHVTVTMRKQVFARYRVPYEKHALYELDHLVPRELGGTDDVANLWPQMWPDAHTKDREENRLHRAVCAGTTSLVSAQNIMRRWGQR